MKKKKQLLLFTSAVVSKNVEDEKSSVLYDISNTGFTNHLVFIPFSREQHI